jgi:hypothetical protein
MPVVIEYETKPDRSDENQLIEQVFAELNDRAPAQARCAAVRLRDRFVHIVDAPRNPPPSPSSRHSRGSRPGSRSDSQRRPTPRRRHGSASTRPALRSCGHSSAGHLTVADWAAAGSGASPSGRGPRLRHGPPRRASRIVPERHGANIRRRNVELNQPPHSKEMNQCDTC